MKKTALALLVVLTAGISLTSCKKDYTCSCKISIPSDSTGGITIEGVDSTYSVAYNDSKKKDAESNCNNLESTHNQAAVLFNGSVNCDLK